LAIHSIGLRDVYLDIHGNIKPLYLKLDPIAKQHKVVNSTGLSMSYWSRLAISLSDVRIVLYEGKRLILDPSSQPGTYLTALFVEMLTPISRDCA